MDEELKKMLEQAKANGAKDSDLSRIIDLYESDNVKKKIGTQPTGESTTPPQKLVSETSTGSLGGVDPKIKPFNGFSNTDLSGYKDKTAKPVINNKLVQQINPNAIKEKQLKTYLSNTKVTPENMDEVTAKTNEFSAIQKANKVKNAVIANNLLSKINNVDVKLSKQRLKDAENDNQFIDYAREFAKGVVNTASNTLNETVIKPLNIVSSTVTGQDYEKKPLLQEFDTMDKYVPLKNELLAAKKENPNSTYQEQIEVARQKFIQNDIDKQKASKANDILSEVDPETQKIAKTSLVNSLDLKNNELKANTTEINLIDHQYEGLIDSIDDDNEKIKDYKSKGIALDQNFIDKYNEKSQNVSLLKKRYADLLNKNNALNKDVEGTNKNIELFKLNYNPFDKFIMGVGSSATKMVGGVVGLASEILPTEGLILKSKDVENFGRAMVNNADEQMKSFRRIALDDVQDVNDFGRYFSNLVAEQVPVLAAASTGVGGLAFLGAGSGGQKTLEMRKELETNPSKYSNAQVKIAGLAFGLAEAIPEIQTLNIIRGAERTIASISSNIAERELFYNGIKSNFKIALDSGKKVLLNSVKEGLSENATGIMQDYIDEKVLGQKVNNKKNKRTEEFFSGFIMGGGMTAFAEVPAFTSYVASKVSSENEMRAVRDKLKTLSVYESELKKEGLTEDDKKTLKSSIESTNKDIANAIKLNIQGIEKLSKIQIEELVNLTTKQSDIRLEAENVKKGNLIDEIKKIKLAELKSEFKLSEEKRNAIKNGSLNSVELLPLQELEKIKKEALKELTAEQNPDGKKDLKIDDKQILERANKNYLKQIKDAETQSAITNETQPKTEVQEPIISEQAEVDGNYIYEGKEYIVKDSSITDIKGNLLPLDFSSEESTYSKITTKGEKVVQPIPNQEAKVEDVAAPSVKQNEGVLTVVEPVKYPTKIYSKEDVYAYEKKYDEEYDNIITEIDLELKSKGITSFKEKAEYYKKDSRTIKNESERNALRNSNNILINESLKKSIDNIVFPKYFKTEDRQKQIEDRIKESLQNRFKTDNIDFDFSEKLQGFLDGSEFEGLKQDIVNSFLPSGLKFKDLTSDQKTEALEKTTPIVESFVKNISDEIIQKQNEATSQNNSPTDGNLPIRDNTDLQQGQVEAVQPTSNVGESKNNVEVEHNGVFYSKNKDGNWVNTKTNNEIKGIGEKGKELIKILDNKSAVSSNQTKGTEASGKTDQREEKHTKIGLTFDAYQDFYKKVAEMPNKDSVLGEYQSGGTIKKVTESEPTNDQTYEGVDFKTQIEHGQNVLENAKEVFGNEYVEKTLDFLQDSNLDGFSKAVVYSALERNLDAMVKENPTDASILALQKLVYADSQANLRIGSLIVNSGRLRAFAKGLEEGFDRELITNTVFTPKQKEAKVVLESLTPSGEGANKAQEDKHIEEQEQLKYTQKDFDEELKKELQKAQQSTGAGAKARELASKIREKGVLPDWLKASDAQQQFIKDNDVKNNGININEAFAKALETFADLHDATNNFKESVKEAFAHIRDWHNENKLKFNEDEYLKNFAETVRIKEKGNRVMSAETKRKIYIKLLNKHIEALDTQIEAKKRTVVETKEDVYKNDFEIQQLRSEKKSKQEQLEKIDPIKDSEKKRQQDLNRKINDAKKRISDLENNIETDNTGKSTVWNKELSEVKTRLQQLRGEKKSNTPKQKQIDAVNVVKQALIDYNNGEFTHTVKRNGEETKVLDWTKIIGRANDPKNIKIAVEKVLENQNFSQSEKNRLSESLEKEYDDLSERNIKKATDDLVRKNLVKPNVVTKTDIERLVQYQNQGLLGENAKNYERLINKIVGLTDVEQTTLDKINEEVEKIKNIYATEIDGKRFDKKTLRSKENEVTNRIKKIISLSNFSNSPASLKGIKALSELAGLSRKAVLGNLYNSIQNIYSGKRQRLLSDIKGRALGYTTPELRKAMKENAKAISIDMMINRGLDYGETVSPFTSHTIISDLAKDKIADIFGTDKSGRLAQGVYNVAEGHYFLNVADSKFKSRIVGVDFVMNTVDILTANRKGHQKMTKPEAVEFVSNALTGVNLTNAKVTAKKFIDAVNEKQPNTIEDNEFSVTRFANEIVRENLLSGNHLTIEEINDSFNSAYYSGGKNIGHEANNIITKQVNFLNNYIDTKEQDALKEKEYGTALMYGTLGLVQKNIVNPYVGGGMNWAVLEFEAGLPVVGVVAAIAKKGNFNLKANELDLETQTGIKNRKKQLQERREVESTLLRGLWGTAVSTATFLTYSAITGNSGASDDDDENKRKFNQYLKENPEQRKIFTKFAPDVLAYTLAYNDEKLSKVILQKIGSRSDDNIISLIKTIQDPNKSTAGAFGELAGAIFSTPFAWRVFRDSQRLYHELKGDPLNQTQFKTTSFWNGYYKGAFVDWLGYRPEVNYYFNKMSKKIDLEKEKFTKETNDIANDIVDKKITELEANKIIKTKYGNNSKKLGKAINIIKDAYQDKDIRTKLEGADYWFMEFYKEKDINKKAILYSQKCLKEGFKADAEFNKNMALVLADFSNEKFQNLKDLAIEIKDYEASLNKKK